MTTPELQTLLDLLRSRQVASYEDTDIKIVFQGPPLAVASSAVEAALAAAVDVKDLDKPPEPEKVRKDGLTPSQQVEAYGQEMPDE